MNHWTQAARGAHLFWLPIPAYAALPFILWIFIQTTTIFLVALFVCLFLTILKLKGRTVPWLIRRAHCLLRGERIFGRTVFYRRSTINTINFDII